MSHPTPDPEPVAGPPAAPAATTAPPADADAPAAGRGSRLLTLGSALFLAVVLLFAGGDKLFHYGGFVRALDSYVVVPAGAEAYLALPVILAELVAGLGLLVAAWRRRAAALSAALLATFTAALLVQQRLAPGVEPCGCTFTITLGEGDGLHVALNVLLIAIAVGLVLDPGGAGRRRDPAP